MRSLLASSVLLGGLLAAGHLAQAQTTTSAYDPDATQRTVQALEVWPELQGEIALLNGDYLLLTVRGERNTNDVQSGRPLGFDTRRVAAAYEHFWNENWSWGGTLRYESDARFEAGSRGDIVVPELLLRHRSPIFGGLTFGQRLGVERQFYISRRLGGAGNDGQFWGRLRFDVERFIPLGSDVTGLALRPRLSYAASTHLRFQKDTNDPDERTIQFTSLRGEVGVRLSPNIDVTPWVAYQTQYSVALPQYQPDASGNLVQVRGGRTNNVYPTLGLDLRFTLVPGSASANRQQLPTQH
jgi:opacity protein-like surface antigen